MISFGNEGLAHALLADSNGRIGFLGVSAGKPLFERSDVMAEYIVLLRDRFDSGIVLIADRPKRFNIMALEGLTEAAAAARAEAHGDRLHRQYARLVANAPSVRIARWSDFEDAKHHSSVCCLRGIYEEDAAFAATVHSFVDAFLSAPNNQAKWAGRAKPVAVAKEYVLDELAMMADIPGRFPKPLTEIYPGRLYLDIVLEQHPHVAAALAVPATRRSLEVYCDGVSPASAARSPQE